MFQFYKYYEDESHKKVLLQSEIICLNLDTAQTHDERMARVFPIVKLIVHILKAQVSAVSQNEAAKRAQGAP